MYILDVVHSGNGSIGIGVLVITNESETTATTCVAILDNDLRNYSVHAHIDKG